MRKTLARLVLTATLAAVAIPAPAHADSNDVEVLQAIACVAVWGDCPVVADGPGLLAWTEYHLAHPDEAVANSDQLLTFFHPASLADTSNGLIAQGPPSAAEPGIHPDRLPLAYGP